MFLPSADTKVERLYTWQQSSNTASVEVLLDGEETTDVPTASTEQTSERSLTVTDTFTRSDVNRHLELTRSFDDISFEASGVLSLDTGNGADAKLSLGCEGDSELDGIAVQFMWEHDTEEYRVKYAEDYDGPAELLEPLRPDDDFLALLPPADQDIDVGSVWDIEPADLKLVLLPGGAVPIPKESEMDAIEGVVDPMLMPGVLDTLDGESSGEVTAELKSDADGVAVIKVSIDVKFLSDQSAAVEGLLAAAAPEDIALELEGAQFHSGLQGTGTLVWDTERHLAKSFTLDLDTTLDVAIAVQVDGMGISAPFQLHETREGTLHLDMETVE